MTFDPTALLGCLEIAVPMRVDELLRMTPDDRADQVRRWADAAVDEIACRGDVLMYGGKRGEAAQVFGHLARAVAVGALLPGGITFAGRHWRTDPTDCRTAGATP